MSFFSNIFREVKLQLTDTPSYVPRLQKMQLSENSEFELTSQQLERAIENPTKKLIFVLGPSGGGKTSHIIYFLRKHPHLRYVYKSFVKVNSIDFAFLHLTSLIGRFFFISISLTTTYLLVKTSSPFGSLPFLFALGYFFMKNSANMMYLTYEALRNIFWPRHQLVVIEDLEKSSLGANDRWALLANLWHNKRTYLISLSYPQDAKQEKMKLIEQAMKLDSNIVEIPTNELVNYQIIKEKDPDFPFEMTDEKASQHKKVQGKGVQGWLSLFTPQELLMICEQVSLRVDQLKGSLEKKLEKKQMIYILLCLDHLTKKMGLQKDEITVDEVKREIQGLNFDSQSEENKFFIQNFLGSLTLPLSVKLNITKQLNGNQ